MKKALGYGLVLLAASTLWSRSALAWSNGAEIAAGGDGVQFFFGSGPITVRGGQGYLGIDFRDVTPDQVATLKLKEARGAEIIHVDHDAPAGKAGLREHDVVLQMNGQVIAGRDELHKMLHECAPGRTLVLVISRDGQQMTVSTQMSTQEEVERQAREQHLTVADPQAAQPEVSGNDFAPAGAAPAVRGNSFIDTMLMNPSYTGAMLEQMSTQLADYFGVSSGAGLLVRSVEPNSPADVAGLRAGDVVVRADAKPVASTGDWAKTIKNCHGRALTIVVMRDKKEQTLTLTPDGKKRSSVEQPGEEKDAAMAHAGFEFRPRS